MEENLLELSTEKLLNKFGAGNHKPGSGSAAAFQGMLSAKLLATVISLTNEEKRRKRYADSLPRLLQMDKDIQERIFPELCRLFQEDSVQFGKTITSRKERDNEKDLIKKSILARQALDDLKIAIDLPLRIADLSVELAEMAAFVFDKAFQGARGDTQVALSGAVAAIGGCLSIVQLNLLQYESDEYIWTNHIRTRVNQLQASFEKLNSIATSKMGILESELKERAVLHQEVHQLISQSKGRKYVSDADIENYATQLQRLIWKHQNKIWKKKLPASPIEMLKADTVFKHFLGYGFHEYDDLGFNNAQGAISSIAGEINQKERLVFISKAFPHQIQRFTAAHELGHAMLHEQAVLHRDLPIDSTEHKGPREPQELQADKFAAFFLMPRKQIIRAFEERFLTDRFVINENTAFNLMQNSPSRLASECRDLHGLCRKLAEAESFAGEPFVSIAELFNVSIGAMAIRLEELGLVEF